MELAFLMCCGSWFHFRGAQVEKARSANVTRCVLGSVSCGADEVDRSRLRPVWSWSMLERYSGACWWRDLKVRTKILKLILSLTGSQWRWMRSLVTGSYFLLLAISRAAVRWTFWRHSGTKLWNIKWFKSHSNIIIQISTTAAIFRQWYNLSCCISISIAS